MCPQRICDMSWPAHVAAGRPAPSAAAIAEAGPWTTKHRSQMTPAELQASSLSKLMADPAKEVKIPAAPTTEKTLRPPREMMKNVSGSSAGAGSGDFHVYKHARRREYERIKLMESADKKVR